jgi:hypothetical protein
MVNAQEMLDRYIEAEAAVLAGQQFRFRSVSGSERMLTKADIQFIQNGRAYWEKRVNATACSYKPISFAL